MIKIKYAKVSKERRVTSDFIDMKQLTEEQITLLHHYEGIIYALQKEDLTVLSKGSFRIDLKF